MSVTGQKPDSEQRAETQILDFYGGPSGNRTRSSISEEKQRTHKTA
jgi:hypothetical protein